MLVPLIPTKVHGVIDYIGAVSLIALPWILGITQHSFASWIFVGLGIGSILYSLVTRYEAGYVGLISMRTHLWLDMLVGFLLIIWPWAMDFSDYVYMPHVIVGSIIIVLALVTSKKAEVIHGPKLKPPPKEQLF